MIARPESTLELFARKDSISHQRMDSSQTMTPMKPADCLQKASLMLELVVFERVSHRRKLKIVCLRLLERFLRILQMLLALVVWQIKMPIMRRSNLCFQKEKLFQSTSDSTHEVSFPALWPHPSSYYLPSSIAWYFHSQMDSHGLTDSALMIRLDYCLYSCCSAVDSLHLKRPQSRLESFLRSCSLESHQKVGPKWMNF